MAAARPETARSPASACPMWAVDYVAPHHLRRGQTMIAIESSSPANAGMTARPSDPGPLDIGRRRLEQAEACPRDICGRSSAPGSESDIVDRAALTGQAIRC